LLTRWTALSGLRDDRERCVDAGKGGERLGEAGTGTRRRADRGHAQGLPGASLSLSLSAWATSFYSPLTFRCERQYAREVLDIAAAAIRPGVTTLEIDEIVHAECLKRDSYPSPLGYHLFPRSVCTSVNEVICHGALPSLPCLPFDGADPRPRPQASPTHDRSRMATFSTLT